MRISELAERTGVPKTTIHYYQRENLLPPPLKTSQTSAYYGPEHVQRLEEIRKQREEELLSISEIKRISTETAPGMPQPARRKRGVLTRQLILGAALEKFSAKGYRKTKVTDIISEAGISNMTFYRYFSGKRDLFLAVVEEVVDELVTRAEKGLEKEEDIVKRMIVRAKAFYDIYSRNREIIHILWGESVGEDEELSMLVKRIYRLFTNALARDIRDLQAKGEFPLFDAEITAYALLGSTELVCFRVSIDDKYSLENFLRNVTQVLLSLRQMIFWDSEELIAPYSGFISELTTQKDNV